MSFLFFLGIGLQITIGNGDLDFTKLRESVTLRTGGCMKLERILYELKPILFAGLGCEGLTLASSAAITLFGYALVLSSFVVLVGRVRYRYQTGLWSSN